ncbi:MAG: EamA family transporter [Micropepsaceae bacterium]
MSERAFHSRRFTGPGYALLSAILFGASTPLAKLLGEEVNAFLLAGLLYLGSGLGLAAWQVARWGLNARKREAPLQRADLRWIVAVVIVGGVAAPVLLMLGLKSTPGSTASLLLNLEGLATMAIAWLVYRESVDRQLLIGAFAILVGAIVLTWDFSALSLSMGALLISAACIGWGVDNNLTRKLSAADPVQIAMIKGLVAGATNVTLGLVTATQMPSPNIVLAAGLLGFLSYGVSLVLFVLALRALGAARTGAYFSTAPFVGALIAIPLLGETMTVPLIVAATLMAIGVWLHLTENHDHGHEHETLTHAHAHVHDEHHQHAHAASDPPGEPHAHEHTHAPLRHKHQHFPDLHHRHGH